MVADTCMIVCSCCLREPGKICTEIHSPRRESLAGAVGGGGIGIMIGRPSLHLLDRAQAARIWLAAEATDMRCGFDQLAERVRAVIGSRSSQR